jgi:hypothetical protein
VLREVFAPTRPRRKKAPPPRKEELSRGGVNSASSLDLRKVATSAQRLDASPVLDDSTLRRRYSSGNMRALYSEDEVFSMDDVPQEEKEKGKETKIVPSYAEARQNWAERCYVRSRREPIIETTRTEWFLLIENLTKNMIRPCVLDLKMGTRQYGYPTLDELMKCPFES